MPSTQATIAVSSVVRLDRHRHVPTLASAVAVFLAEHHLSASSRRVYASALRGLESGMGVDTPLAALGEPHAADQLAVWFHTRYEHTAPATRVRHLAILRSACAYWRKHAWLTADLRPDWSGPESRSIALGH